MDKIKEDFEKLRLARDKDETLRGKIRSNVLRLQADGWEVSTVRELLNGTLTS